MGAPGPSVDMPIIGLPRRQPTPARSLSTRLLCVRLPYGRGLSRGGSSVVREGEKNNESRHCGGGGRNPCRDF
jgi:hypothetical protein